MSCRACQPTPSAKSPNFFRIAGRATLPDPPVKTGSPGAYEQSADRIPELKGLARWMSAWAKQEDDWSHNLIALGDFNIDRQGDPLWQAFTSTGLKSPEALNTVPRTIFSDPNKPESGKFYDQIAWFHDADGRPRLSMTCRSAGFVDFLPYVYRDQGLTKQAISYRISDHYPLWAEFALG